MAYRVFWTQFGEGALLALLASQGNTAADPTQHRRVLCLAFSGSLRALREETQFPFPPDMPPDAAKIAGAAFHKTFRHLEVEFWKKASKLSPELTPSL
jgi:hypothetical protein